MRQAPAGADRPRSACRAAVERAADLEESGTLGDGLPDRHAVGLRCGGGGDDPADQAEDFEGAHTTLLVECAHWGDGGAGRQLQAADDLGQRWQASLAGNEIGQAEPLPARPQIRADLAQAADEEGRHLPHRLGV